MTMMMTMMMMMTSVLITTPVAFQQKKKTCNKVFVQLDACACDVKARRV
jgi:hypothetical protein